MALLHDASTRAAIERRLGALTSTSQHRWGKMSVDQILHHVNHAPRSALGREPATLDPGVPLPKWILKFFVLYVPWPRGAPTAPEWISGDRYDFEDERRQTVTLIDEVSRRPLGAEWPRHTIFGDVGGRYW